MFKRFITVLTVVSLLFSILSLGFTANAYYNNDILYGDVDGIPDEKGEYDVDTADALLALRIASGVETLEDEEQLVRADVNFDGYVTLFDARQILRGAAGLASLQPSGAFEGFEDNGLFYGEEERLVAYFNAYLNRIKVVESEENKYIAATITKTEWDSWIDDKDVPFIKEANLFGETVDVSSIADTVKQALVEDDKDNRDEPEIISFGSDKYSEVSVEGEDYVSNLSVSDVYGSRASYDNATGQLTIEIALLDTEIEMANQSAYSKVFNTTEMIAEQNTTLMKLMKMSSGEASMLREFKNGVLKIVVDVNTSNVLEYTATYESKVYVSQVQFTSALSLKHVNYRKMHVVKYEDFQWPPVQ